MILTISQKIQLRLGHYKLVIVQLIFASGIKNPISFVFKDPQAYLVFCGKHPMISNEPFGSLKNKNEKIKQISALTFSALDDDPT